MVLNIDGSRNRRLGMDYEANFDLISTTIVDDGTAIATSTYRWDNAGGDPERSIEVVQVGNELKFFHLTEESVSAGFFNTQSFTSSKATNFSYTVVDGILVLVNGDKDIYLFEYIHPNTITRSTKRLLIRDLFGVSDIISGVDIARANGVQNRLSILTNNHTYNLRNQSWAIPRLPGNEETPYDPIQYFFNLSGVWPSNSDTVTEVLYPASDDTDNRTVDRFFAQDLIDSPLGTTRAPLGYFIIDALDRGPSRIQFNNENMVRYPELILNVTTLPADTTPGGAKAIAEYAGRVWYAGFPGEVIDGDTHSPKMSSYLLFSKVVDNSADINICYQEGDPTSKTGPDIIATDGGFIRINEAYGIKKLINLGSSLVIVAANGIWRISGGSENGFTATSYIVEKITDRGCTSPDSITQMDNTFMFWSDDAIYHVTTDQFGSWVCNNISFGRIQRFYDGISVESKRRAHGAYDTYERKIRWVYNNFLAESIETKELVLDIQLQAYYVNTIKELNETNLPKVVAVYIGLPYKIDVAEIEIFAGADLVQIGTDSVVISSEQKTGSFQREIGYLVVHGNSPTVSYTFSRYTDTGFRDWRSIDGIGVDAEAYVVTSHMSGGDFQRDKQVPYITVHLRRTESGYDDEMNPINPSSCLLQSRWGWSSADFSGKWGKEFQAYRYRRMHLPVDNSDNHDNGFSVISSRNKLRGDGKVLSLRFRTEPDKDLHLYGWSMVLSVSENV